MPAEDLRHDAGRERAHERRDHPRGGERREDLWVQRAGIDAGHQHIQRDGQGSPAEALHQAACHEHRHRYSGSRDQQSQHKQRDGGVERGRGSAPVRPVSGRNHADHPSCQRTREGEGVECRAVEFAADEGHDGGDGKGFERGQEHQGARSHRHPEVWTPKDARRRTGGWNNGILHLVPAPQLTYRLRPARYPKTPARRPTTRNRTPAAAKDPVAWCSWPTISVPVEPSP